MPKALDDCVKKLIAEGKTESQAWAICTAQFKKRRKPIRKGVRKNYDCKRN